MFIPVTKGIHLTSALMSVLVISTPFICPTDESVVNNYDISEMDWFSVWITEHIDMKFLYRLIIWGIVYRKLGIIAFSSLRRSSWSLEGSHTFAPSPPVFLLVGVIVISYVLGFFVLFDAM